MAIYSPLRSRRSAAQTPSEPTQRFITFKLGTETFALPIERIHKVTTLDKLYGDPDRVGVSLTNYQGRELVTIDVGYRIFNRPPQLPGATSDDPQAVKYLLVLKTEDGRPIGLPLEAPPSIQSLQLSAFQPLPEIYRQHSNIDCVSSLAIDTPDGASIFLLDIDAIVAG